MATSETMSAGSSGGSDESRISGLSSSGPVTASVIVADDCPPSDAPPRRSSRSARRSTIAPRAGPLKVRLEPGSTTKRRLSVRTDPPTRLIWPKSSPDSANGRFVAWIWPANSMSNGNPPSARMRTPRSAIRTERS